MTDLKDTTELEAALLDRAERLAAEYLAHGQDGRAAILREEQQRLRSREQHIIQDAEVAAERLYRRRVQAAQLRLQGSLDKLRWELMQSIFEDLPERLVAYAGNESAYEQLLQALLMKAAKSTGDAGLTVELNARDFERLQRCWDDFCAQVLPDRSIALDPEPRDCSGGLCVSSLDKRERVDATFEGRMERFHDELMQSIAAELFAHDTRKAV